MKKTSFGRTKTLVVSLTALTIFGLVCFAGEESIPVDENLVVVMTDIHQGTTLPKGRGAIPAPQLLKERRFHQACERIAAMNPRPAHVILLGDIAYLDGAMVDYEKAKESFDLLDKAKIAWTATLGNHDRIENFFAVFPEKKLETEPVPGRLTRKIETPNADILLLDTHQESDTPIEKENPGDGALDDAQRTWLAEQVADYNVSKKRFFVGSHHPGFETGVAVGPTLRGAETFDTYLFGHWHWLTTRAADDGLNYVCFPSTAYTFGKQPLGFTLMNLADAQKTTLSLSVLDDMNPLNNAPVESISLPAKPFGYVCTDGGNGGYEAFPDVCRLADGRLLCVFYDGWTHISLNSPKGATQAQTFENIFGSAWVCSTRPDRPNGGRISGCYSADEGKTWSEPFVLIDTPADDRDASITQLADGKVLCNWFTYELGEKGKEAHCTLMLAESADGGQTWSEPRKLFDDVPCSSPIRVLSTGRLILPTYVETDTEHSGSVAYSDDGGATWSQNIVIPNGKMKLDAETDVIELKDGTLYALQRDKMAFSISGDKGKTWSESRPVGFDGHCPYLLRVKKGNIVAAFRLPNTSMRISTDECKTWSGNFLVDDCVGAYPSMVELKDGSILIVYYEEGEGSSLRARRFRVHDGHTIEWLAL